MYEFLKQEPLPGGYHENRKFIFQVRDRLIDKIDDEVRTSMGLVEERRYIEQFERYVAPRVALGQAARRCRNPITGPRRGARRGHDGARSSACWRSARDGATSSGAR